MSLTGEDKNKIALFTVCLLLGWSARPPRNVCLCVYECVCYDLDADGITEQNTDLNGFCVCLCVTVGS